MTNTALRDQCARDIDTAIAETIVLRRLLEIVRRHQHDIDDVQLQRIVHTLNVHEYVERVLADLGGYPFVISLVNARKEVQP